MTSPLKGRKLSPEHRRKVIAASRGRKHPPRSAEWRRKQRIAKLGKKRAPTSQATKEKIRIANLKNGTRPPVYRGKDCHFWKGGITPINEAIRKSLQYRLWRSAVFKRDGYACIWGGKEHGKKIHADHIKPFALFPELRFAIDNGRTLCEECHRKTDTYGFKTRT
jgi:hypothetical protein